MLNLLVMIILSYLEWLLNYVIKWETIYLKLTDTKMILTRPVKERN